MAQVSRVPSGVMFDPILGMVSSFSGLGSVCPELLLHPASWFPPLGGSEYPGRAQEIWVLALPLSAFPQWLWASVPLFVASLYPVPLLMGSPVLAIGRCHLGDPAQSLGFCPLVFDPWNQVLPT